MNVSNMTERSMNKKGGVREEDTAFGSAWLIMSASLGGKAQANIF